MIAAFFAAWFLSMIVAAEIYDRRKSKGEKMPPTNTYGREVGSTYMERTRSVIQPDGLSANGNLILRVGQENEYLRPGWHQTEHVVLTPDEARRFIAECAALLDGEIVAA